MPKKYHFSTFHRHNSSSSNSSLENYHASVNMNTRKQQKLAEKMIRRVHGYGALSNVSQNPFDEMSDPCATPADHGEISTKTGHYEAHEGHEKHGTHNKNGGKHYHLGHHKWPGHHNENGNNCSQVDHCYPSTDHHLNDVPSEHCKPGGHGEHHWHSFQDLFAGIAGHVKHHGKNHNFNRHKMSERHDGDCKNHHQMDPWGSDANQDKHDRNEISNVENGTHGSRRHTFHIGVHGKHHGKHHNFGHHKICEHHDALGDQHNQMDPWGTNAIQDIHDRNDVANVNGGGTPTRRHTIHIGLHGKHHGKHHNFGHHKMHDPDDNDHHHGYHNKVGKH